MDEAPDEFTATAAAAAALEGPGPGAAVVGSAGPARRPTAPAGGRPPRNVRWERLSEVLRDLEELRGVGERLLIEQPLAAAQSARSRAVAIPKGRSSNDPSKGCSG